MLSKTERNNVMMGSHSVLFNEEAELGSLRLVNIMITVVIYK